MSNGIITDIGRQWIAEQLQRGIDLAGSLTSTLDAIEIGTGTPDVSISGVTDIAVDGDKRSYASTTTDWVAEGVVVGGLLTITGFTNSNNNITDGEVLKVTTTEVHIKGNTTMVTEAAGDSITINGYVLSATSTGVKTALASGGRITLDSGYPQATYVAGAATLIVKATFAAGSFTTGTAITEAVWSDLSTGAIIGGRVILDDSKNPTASEPLTITMQFPLVVKNV